MKGAKDTGVVPDPWQGLIERARKDPDIASYLCAYFAKTLLAGWELDNSLRDYFGRALLRIAGGDDANHVLGVVHGPGTGRINQERQIEIVIDFFRNGGSANREASKKTACDWNVSRQYVTKLAGKFGDQARSSMALDSKVGESKWGKEYLAHRKKERDQWLAEAKKKHLRR